MLRERNLGGCSPRPLGRTLGVSPRLLLYDFPSREQFALALQNRSRFPGFTEAAIDAAVDRWIGLFDGDSSK